MNQFEIHFKFILNHSINLNEFIFVNQVQFKHHLLDIYIILKLV
jgi:hypothetical protein